MSNTPHRCRGTPLRAPFTTKGSRMTGDLNILPALLLCLPGGDTCRADHPKRLQRRAAKTKTFVENKLKNNFFWENVPTAFR